MTDTIDPEKLEEAIREYAKLYRELDDGERQIGLVLNAARAHLATLSKYKEVEREWFEVLLPNNRCGGVYSTIDQAKNQADKDHGAVVVRLTGTAKVRA